MEEHYVQNVSAGVPSGLLRSGGQRDLRSDVLLVRVGGEFEWQPRLRMHIRFALDGRDETAKTKVWLVKYEERARPTLIRGERDTDLPVSGRFWIDADSGQVLRSELVACTGARSARVTTRFRVNEIGGIAVPVEMTEEYQIQRSCVTATATDSRIRQFGVSTTTNVAPARP